MKIGKLRLTHADKFVIAEFICIVIATLLFLWGVFDYWYNYTLQAEIWGWFAFFMLAKNWAEFYETTEDRRVHTMTVEELNKLDIQLKRMGDI